jgi:hypothetical protein
MNEQSDLVTRYVKNVQTTIERYTKNQNVITKDEILPESINRCLADYMINGPALIAEFERAEIDLYDSQKKFDKWFDKKFLESREKLTGESTAKTSKIAVSEISTYVRVNFESEYYSLLDELELKKHTRDFLRRLRTQYDKVDKILCELSGNTRSELRSLSLENRMNDPKIVSRIRARREFPSEGQSGS